MVLRYKEQLGLAIRRRRLELGLTHRQLIERLHIKETQTVSRWERGVTAPSDLEALAKALEWTIPAMMAGIKPPTQTARKLGITPQPDPSQLDRIEGMLARLLEEQGLSPEEDADRLIEEIETESQARARAQPGVKRSKSEGAAPATRRRAGGGRRGS